MSMLEVPLILACYEVDSKSTSFDIYFYAKFVTVNTLLRVNLKTLKSSKFLIF